jgi:hypothetical protein
MSIQITPDNYLIINDVKICRVLPGNVLEFHDKNRQRSARYGGPPTVDALEFIQTVAKAGAAVDRARE